MANEKKRILIIDGPLGGGGAERVLIDLLRNIDYSRYDVDLAVICRGGALMDEVPTDVNVIELWPSYNLSYKLAFRLSKYLRSNALFAAKMNGPKLRRDYDLEISFLEGMPLKLGALRTTDARKATWVHADICTDPYEASQFFPGEEKRDYDRMDFVVNVSDDCRKAFLRRFPDCKANAIVIYNPIDRKKILRMAAEEPLPEATKADDRLTVITVGRITAQKAPERMLRVAQLAKEAGLPVKFKWVGDGPLRPQMEKLRDELGLQDMVEYTGFTKNPFAHIKASDIMMVTSDFEGFCLVICEAMCLGVPVISTKSAGPTEILGDNEYGELTDFSAEAMFDTLRRWVDNPELRRRYAEKALSRPDDFSVERALNALYALADGQI